MIRTNKEWRAKQLTEGLSINGVANKISALSLSIMALGLMTVSKVNANDVPLPIKHISLNNDNQIVVWFGKREGEFPSPPHLLDAPGPNHRIVIDFADATVDKVNMPGAADLSTKLHKQLSAIKSIRYQTVTTGETVKARVVIEIPELLKVRPRVVKLEEESVTINLGDDIVEQSAALDEPSGRGRPQSMDTAAATSVVASSKDAVTEIPMASNSETSVASDTTSGSAPKRMLAESNEVVAASPAVVPVAAAPLSIAAVDSGTPALRTDPLTVAADGSTVIAADSPAITAAASPIATTTATSAVTTVESESTSQLAESMPTSPKSKTTPAASSKKMPESITNAGANLKKMMHWPHKDDASTTSSKEADKSESTKEAVAESKKEVVESKKNTKDSNSDTSSAAKSGKMSFLSKLPRPAFAKSKNDKSAEVASGVTKKTANTVVESNDVTIATAAGSSKTAITEPGPEPVASSIPVAEGIGDAPPAGAEFGVSSTSEHVSTSTPSAMASSTEVTSAPVSESATGTASTVSNSTSTSTPTAAATSSAVSETPAPGSWDWTATQAAGGAKSTRRAVVAVKSDDAPSESVVSQAASTTSADQADSSKPVKVAQGNMDDDRPKISTPIETTETHTFSEPAQVLSTGASTTVTPGAQGMMKIKSKEQEVKDVTVADTEKSTFADALKSTPNRKAPRVEATSAANEPALIRDTEMVEPSASTEQTATKPVVEAEPAATEIPTQSAEMTPASPAPGEVESAGEDKGKLALAKYNMAVKAHLAGKLPEAIMAYKEALEANPGLAEAHSNLGLIYNQQHKYELAVSEFQKALAINPKDAITYNGIGAALRAQRDLMGAIKNWQTAVTLDPKLATAHYNLGVAYELQRDYDKSLVSYEQAIKCDFRLGEAYYRMGMILEKRHRNEDARVKFKAALKASENADYSADARQRLALLESTKVIK